MKPAKFEINRTGISLAAGFSTLYILCLLIVGISPGSGMMMYRSTFHMAAPAYPSLAVIPGITGLVLVIIAGYILGAVFAAVYNALETR